VLSQQCANLDSDRKLGEYWERQFCFLAGNHGFAFTRNQANKAEAALAWERRADGKWDTYTLPDVSFWTTPGQHHEIKHKSPTRYGCYGLEKYRFDALIWFAGTTGQPVFYTIHDHALSGGRDCTFNSIEHWRTASVTFLADNIQQTSFGSSWVDGVRKSVLIHYWPTSLWKPLGTIWEAPEEIASGPLPAPTV
jgi:hypothetical protein